MQPLEYCLDRILEELKKSWNDSDRPELDATMLLREFDIPQDRHEYFKSLINKTIDDGYVDFIDKVDDRKAVSLETYKTRTMLTAVGYYFIADNGYTKAFKKEAHRKKTQSVKDWLLIAGTWIAGVAAVALVCWEIYKWFFLPDLAEQY